MPKFIALDRRACQDVAAINEYVAERSDGWQLIEGALPKLVRLFAQYPKYYAEPSQLRIMPADAELSSKLYGLYDSSKSYFRYRKVPRKHGKNGCCPYCGIKGSISVDHYLPRALSKYPCFSVLSANLVPACSSCQGHKATFSPKTIGRFVRLPRVRPRNRDDELEESKFRLSERRILHPYFDAFLSERVLVAQVAFGKDGLPVLVSLQPRLNLRGRVRRLISFHLERLHVFERAQGEVAHLHNSIVKGLSRTLEKVEDVEEALQVQLSAAEARGGSKNFFDALYIRALIVRKDFHARLFESALVTEAPLIRKSMPRAARYPPPKRFRR